jgi:hypothetical protein
MLRAIRLVFGYAGLLVGGVVWFICFPLSAYTLYAAGVFPLDYFGVSVYLGFPLDFFLPREMWRAVGGICAAFTLYGLFVIYFNVRKLRRLRRNEDSRGRRV